MQQWLYSAEDGSYESAWRRLVADNPFPAIMGRICYHPCETACNRGQLDSAVGINSVERFLGDKAIDAGWALPEAGAGHRPPGARHRRRPLRSVGRLPAAAPRPRPSRWCDASAQPGGMMRHGIPAFRLPRDVLDIEIARLVDLGVTLRMNTRVDDLEATMREGRFDAALLAMGAPLSKRAYIPAGQSARILDALEVLGDVSEGDRPQLGRTVVVYGGGNTAMDVARTARRLGADETIIVYRRTQAQMPAADVELEEALAEGVQIRWLSTITQVEGTTLTIEKMTLDDEGRPHPTGEFEELSGDAVVLALGQDVDRSVLDTLPGLQITDGVVEVGPDMMTAVPGVFAGGDIAPSERSATVAIGHGTKAARSIDAWLRNRAVERVTPHEIDEQPVEFDRLNPWYFSEAPHTMRPELEAARRTSDFSEVVGGLDERTALFEARRCLSCGNCFGCDNCYGVCPDNAVHKIEGAHGYEIDYDYCKGCGLCVAECPAGAIVMVPEQT